MHRWQADQMIAFNGFPLNHKYTDLPKENEGDSFGVQQASGSLLTSFPIHSSVEVLGLAARVAFDAKNQVLLKSRRFPLGLQKVETTPPPKQTTGNLLPELMTRWPVSQVNALLCTDEAVESWRGQTRTLERARELT